MRGQGTAVSSSPGSKACDKFVENAWRKNMCSNCYRLKSEHSTSAITSSSSTSSSTSPSPCTSNGALVTMAPRSFTGKPSPNTKPANLSSTPTGPRQMVMCKGTAKQPLIPGAAGLIGQKEALGKGKGPVRGKPGVKEKGDEGKVKEPSVSPLKHAKHTTHHSQPAKSKPDGKQGLVNGDVREQRSSPPPPPSSLRSPSRTAGHTSKLPATDKGKEGGGELSPHKSALHHANTSSGERRKSTVGFLDEEVVIGYGGEDVSTFTPDYTQALLDGAGGDDDLDDVICGDDELELKQITEQNTLINSEVGVVSPGDAVVKEGPSIDLVRKKRTEVEHRQRHRKRGDQNIDATKKKSKFTSKIKSFLGKSKDDRDLPPPTPGHKQPPTKSFGTMPSRKSDLTDRPSVKTFFQEYPMNRTEDRTVSNYEKPQLKSGSVDLIEERFYFEYDPDARLSPISSPASSTASTSPTTDLLSVVEMQFKALCGTSNGVLDPDSPASDTSAYDIVQLNHDKLPSSHPTTTRPHPSSSTTRPHPSSSTTKPPPSSPSTKPPPSSPSTKPPTSLSATKPSPSLPTTKPPPPSSTATTVTTASESTKARYSKPLRV